MKDAEKLALKLRPHKEKRGYPEALRLKVGRYIVRCRKEGESWSAIQKKLGLSNATVKSWAEKIASNHIQPVRIKHTVVGIEKINSLTITSPQGWRIEGLHFQRAIELLKEMHR